MIEIYYVNVKILLNKLKNFWCLFFFFKFIEEKINMFELFCYF